MRPYITILISFLFIIGIASAGNQITVSPTGSQSDQDVINKALQTAVQAGGGTVYLTKGTYYVTGSIVIPSSNIILTGDSDAIVKVSPSSSQWFTGTNSIIYSNSNNNIEISGFQIDGSCSSLPFEYHHSRSDTAHDCERAILIMGQTGKFCNNIVVHDMQIYDCFSDGVHIRFANNVHCYSNFISNCEHEGIFWTCVVNGLAESNKIAGITSDCMRCDNCVTFLVKNNYFYSYTGNNNSQAPKGEQNGIQIADAGASKGYDASNKPLSTKDGEVTGNTFANTGEKTVWLDSTGKGYDNVYIHDNTFVNVNVFTNTGVSVTVTITAINASVITYQDTTGTIQPTKNTSESIFDLILNSLTQKYTYQYPNRESNIAANVSIEYYNNKYNPHTVVFVDSQDATCVKYQYNNKSTSHYYSINNGSGSSKTDIWEGNIPTKGNAVYINGAFDSTKLNITCFNSNGYEKISNFKITEIQDDSSQIVFNPLLWKFVGILLILGIFTVRNLRRVIRW